jgi:hypothetical protein
MKRGETKLPQMEKNPHQRQKPEVVPLDSRIILKILVRNLINSRFPPLCGVELRTGLQVRAYSSVSPPLSLQMALGFLSSLSRAYGQH